jgi:predicted Zn-dependent protease
VRVREPISFGKVPRTALRASPFGDGTQIQAGHLMMDVLRPTLPADAAALIGFTARDLYPDETLNFVFGQANLSERLAAFCAEHGLANEEHFFEESTRAFEKN